MDFLKKKMKELLDDDDKPKKDEKPASRYALLWPEFSLTATTRPIQWFP
jgi:hypothetical protein